MKDGREEGKMAVVSKGGLKTFNIYFDLEEAALESQGRDPTSRARKTDYGALGCPTSFPTHTLLACVS